MKTFIPSLLLFLTSVFTAEAQSFSLQEAMAYAKENHNQVKNDLLEIADAKSNIKEFTAIGMPKLNGNVQYQHFLDIPTSIIPTGSFFPGNPDQGIPPNPEEDLAVQFGVKNNLTASLNADFLLFDGSFFVGLQASKTFKDLVEKQTDITKDELAYEVAKAYLGVASALKNQEVLALNVVNLEETLEESTATFEAGFIEKLDLDRLELSLSNLYREQERLAGMIELSKNVLKFAMGYPLGNNINISQSLDDLAPSVYELNTIANIEAEYQDRSEYAVLQVGNELNELNIKRLQFQYLPVLRGFGSYGQILQGNNLSGGRWFPTTVIGLTLDVPIFDGFDKKAKLDRARIERDQHLLSIDNLEKAITLEVENAKVAYENASRALESTQRSLDLAQNIYDTALIKYREGVGASLEITQAERDLYGAQGTYVNALYDLLIAKIDLDKALGNL